jgi:hypothetical protein
MTMLIIICLTTTAQEVPNKSTFNADLQSKRIAAGTTIEVRFLQSLSSINNVAGDDFSACLENDIRINRKVVLPAGTFMRGTVNYSKKSKMLKIPGSLYLDFDHLVTPEGKQLDVSLRLTDITLTKDGLGISGGGSYRLSVCDNFDDSVDLVRNSVDWGNDVGDRFLFGYPKLILTPLSATGGFCASTLMFTGKSLCDVFRRGNEVIIQENQVIKGSLVEPIDLPSN